MTETSSPPRRALVVGATGIAGQTVSRQLIEQGWLTFGLSRGGSSQVAGIENVAADLRDPAALTSALIDTQPELVIIVAWMRNDTEAENITVNSALIRNVLAALEPQKSVRHVALMTGLKHYLGPFEAYGQGVMSDTPFHEDAARVDAPNFYYAQEDELFAASERTGFTWSVHRAHTVFGYAVGTAMNMVLTLSVYATICKELGLPMVFPGSDVQWNGITDVTDANLLAEQIIWAGTNPAGENEAFNIANGDVFRWRTLWPQIAEHFGVGWEGFVDAPRTLEVQMAGMENTWAALADKNGLAETDLTRLASWWHSDGDLGRTIECFTDMTKSRTAGFGNFRATPRSFFDTVEQYRAARILP
ncbi:SDR family oxidoreductase [Cryobacterium sp. CG_9.6]|uniref:SDR family oxidoreductase n=1 Tax=Cryobacterium sp. CG_9.6 TaxID=2760710 RepID=UPI0024745965|nr:SDR family oxidoreductase [Cryobacterium sp. CG_9.6]MDH6235873.1 nucleoside-diphosphate-sugar epimerase [Cryobacterium sp. CG_9.6]